MLCYESAEKRGLKRHLLIISDPTLVRGLGSLFSKGFSTPFHPRAPGLPAALRPVQCHEP